MKSPKEDTSKQASHQERALQQAHEKAREALAAKYLEQRKKAALEVNNNNDATLMDTLMADIKTFCAQHWKQLDEILAKEESKGKGSKRGRENDDDQFDGFVEEQIDFSSMELEYDDL